MELKLVPIEGEKIISEEEKERLKRRAQPVPPEKISNFNEAEQKDIKAFFASLITLTEQIHNDMEHKEDREEDHPEYYEKEMENLQENRKLLFDNPLPAVGRFIELLEFFPMEPWHEFEMLIAGVRGEDVKHYYETKLKAEVDAHYIQVEDNIEAEQEARMVGEMTCRITPLEIRDLVYQHDLEDLVKHLVDGRRLITGEFWDAGYYDF